MKDFDENPECDACGSDRVTIKYHSSSDGRAVEKRWLRVSCQRCGFSCDMKTRLDDLPKETATPGKHG